MKIQSIEPKIADLANGWLRSYGLDYKLEQESLNTEIDKSLKEYFSKNGGVGANRPDAKLLLKDQYENKYPILIEYKWYKDKLVKLDVDWKIDNKNAKNQPNFININSYAVNGAVHYANALLHHSSYTDVIAIGMTWYKDDFWQLQYSIWVYFVSKSNFWVGQSVGEFSDFSFLKKENFDSFIQKIKELNLSPEELERIKIQREGEIEQALKKLNNDIFKEEKWLGTDERVHLVAAAIMATLGISWKVSPLEKEDLTCKSEIWSTDWDIIVRKIEAFLSEKNLPKDKKELIVRT